MAVHPNPEQDSVADTQLERQGRRMAGPGGRLVLAGVPLGIVGIVLIVLGHGWSVGVGIALLLIGSVPATWGGVLLVTSAVTRWSARHKPFA